MNFSHLAQHAALGEINVFAAAGHSAVMIAVIAAQEAHPCNR